MHHLHGWLEIDTADWDQETPISNWLIHRLTQTTELGTAAEVRGIGGTWVLTVNSVMNRERGIVAELREVLTELGARATSSYGVFHARNHDTGGEFEVLAVRRGILSDVTDPFFSPPVPVLQDEL